MHTMVLLCTVCAFCFVITWFSLQISVQQKCLCGTYFDFRSSRDLGVCKTDYRKNMCWTLECISALKNQWADWNHQWMPWTHQWISWKQQWTQWTYWYHEHHDKNRWRTGNIRECTIKNKVYVHLTHTLWRHNHFFVPTTLMYQKIKVLIYVWLYRFVHVFFQSSCEPPLEILGRNPCFPAWVSDVTGRRRCRRTAHLGR